MLMICTVSLSLTDCASPPRDDAGAPPTASAMPDTVHPQPAAEPSRSIEVMPWVENGEDKSTDQNIDLAWHTVAMSTDFVDVVYTLASETLDRVDSGLRLEKPMLRVNDTTVIPAVDDISLADWQGISIGVLRFGGRPAGSEYLQIEATGVHAGNESIAGPGRLRPLRNLEPSADSLTGLYLIPNGHTISSGPYIVSFDSFHTVGNPSPVDMATSQQLDPMQEPTNDLPAAGATPTPVAPALASSDLAISGLAFRIFHLPTSNAYVVAFDITAKGDVVNVASWVETDQAAPQAGSTASPADDPPPTDTVVTLEEARARFPYPLALPASPPLGSQLTRVDYLDLASDGAVVEVVGLTYDNGVQIIQQTIPPGRTPDQIVPEAPGLTRETKVNGLVAHGFDAGISTSPNHEAVPGQIYWHDGDVFYIIVADGLTLDTLRSIAESLAKGSQ